MILCSISMIVIGVPLRITQDGRKTVLGIRQGATENAIVVGELLGDLMNRGLDFAELRLYVPDGGKALHRVVKEYAGDLAPIQRCQVHIAAETALTRGVDAVSSAW